MGAGRPRPPRGAPRTPDRAALATAAIVVQDLLDDGHSLSEAGSTLGLSRIFVHREAQRATEPARRPPEFEAIDAKIEWYVFG